MYDICTMEKICSIVRKIDGDFAEFITEPNSVFVNIDYEKAWDVLRITQLNSGDAISLTERAEKSFLDQPIFVGMKIGSVSFSSDELWATEDFRIKNVPDDAWKEICNLISEHYCNSRGIFRIAKICFEERTFSIDSDSFTEWVSHCPKEVKTPRKDQLPEEYKMLLADSGLMGRLKAGIRGLRNHRNSVWAVLRMLFWRKSTRENVVAKIKRMDESVTQSHEENLQNYEESLRLKELSDKYLDAISDGVKTKKENIRTYLLSIGFVEKEV